MSKTNQPPLDVYPLPEPGQTVEMLRQQRDVRKMTDSCICDGIPAQHLTELSFIAEDKTGEPLNVMLEIEPEVKIVKNAGLPIVEHLDQELEAHHKRHSGTPDQFDAFLDAVRWRAVTNADRKQLASPFRRGITIEDYEFDPVNRSLDAAHVNLLIADVKTIETELVIQEMLVCHRTRTVMVVCPASLQIKWLTEMHEKSGLELKNVDTAYLHELRRKRSIHVNPWTALPDSSRRWTGRKARKDCAQIKLKNVPSLISCQRNAMKNSV